MFYDLVRRWKISRKIKKISAAHTALKSAQSTFLLYFDLYFDLCFANGDLLGFALGKMERTWKDYSTSPKALY